MKKAILIASAFVCVFVIAGIASAQSVAPRYSAGLSPQLAIPQPKTQATLRADANRLIRWQGWLNVDAFSVSVLAQMQKQLGTSIEIGKFTIDDEEDIASAIMKAKKANSSFEVNPHLYEVGENLTNVKLYVWTYRHNYTDTGLYQLYISAKGKMLIGSEWRTERIPYLSQPHKDIQALGYEFGTDRPGGFIEKPVLVDVYADVEIWRGAVVRVNASGEIMMVGNEAGAIPSVGGVEVAPMSDWEIAPSLQGNKNYNPKCASGAPYWNPLDHPARINQNLYQLRPGDVQAEGRVATRPPTVVRVPPPKRGLFR